MCSTEMVKGLPGVTGVTGVTSSRHGERALAAPAALGEVTSSIAPIGEAHQATASRRLGINMFTCVSTGQKKTRLE